MKQALVSRDYLPESNPAVWIYFLSDVGCGLPHHAHLNENHLARNLKQSLYLQTMMGNK
ncbi:MAG: hypothetical protein ABW157_05395 [Candidatus Thiodiazotropha sp. LLP2]